jgi:hypothetical protein
MAEDVNNSARVRARVCSLSSILRPELRPQAQDIFQQAVTRLHVISNTASKLAKLYYLMNRESFLEDNPVVPGEERRSFVLIMGKPFFETVMQVVAPSLRVSGRQPTETPRRLALTALFNAERHRLVALTDLVHLSPIDLSHALDYIAKDLSNNYAMTVCTHYFTKLKQYIECRWRANGVYDRIKKTVGDEQLRKIHRTEYKRILDNIYDDFVAPLAGGVLRSTGPHGVFIRNNRKIFYSPQLYDKVVVLQEGLSSQIFQDEYLSKSPLEFFDSFFAINLYLGQEQDQQQATAAAAAVAAADPLQPDQPPLLPVSKCFLFFCFSFIAN